MSEQVERRYLSCAQDVIPDSCRETRAELRAKFSIIIASHKLKEEPVWRSRWLARESTKDFVFGFFSPGASS